MTSFPKPSKGSALLERRHKRAAIVAREKAEKAKVVARDGSQVCRVSPGCREKEHFETAHLDNKGMGGDRGHRTTAATMIRSCFLHHRGPHSLHSKDLRVEYLTPEQANGPIEVWSRVPSGDDMRGSWYLLKRETSCGVNARD